MRTLVSSLFWRGFSGFFRTTFLAKPASLRLIVGNLNGLPPALIISRTVIFEYFFFFVLIGSSKRCEKKQKNEISSVTWPKKIFARWFRRFLLAVYSSLGFFTRFFLRLDNVFYAGKAGLKAAQQCGSRTTESWCWGMFVVCPDSNGSGIIRRAVSDPPSRGRLCTRTLSSQFHIHQHTAQQRQRISVDLFRLKRRAQVGDPRQDDFSSR
jgi:hypothetical protein